MAVKFITGYLCLKMKVCAGLEVQGFLQSATLTAMFSSWRSGSHCTGVESWQNQRWAEDVSQLVTSLLP